MLCLWYLHGYFLKTPLLDVLKDYFFNMENFLQTSSTIIHWRPMLADEFTSFISHSHFSFHHFYTISLMGLFCIANMATYTCITISSNCKLWFHSPIANANTMLGVISRPFISLKWAIMTKMTHAYAKKVGLNCPATFEGQKNGTI